MGCKASKDLGIQDHRDSLLEEVAMLSEQKAVLVEDLKAAREELNELKQNDLVAALNPFGGLSKIVDKATRVAAIGRGIMARLWTVCDAIFEHAIFGLEATEVVLNKMYQKKFFKRNREVFAPWKVLKAMDLSAVGGLNYNGIETLRIVECTEKYQRGILPARSSVQKTAYELHSLGQQLIPFEQKASSYGEMYQYDFEFFLRYVLKVFNLDVIAETECVELSISLDGAELCDGICHITAGMKITDQRAIDPFTGIPLSTVDNENFGRIFSNQSRNYCFAMKSLLGKDCKRAYKEFADFFKFFERVKKYGL